MIPIQTDTGQAAQPVSIAINPVASYCVLDIETGHASQDVIDAAVGRWKPAPNVTKPETIEAQRKKAAVKIAEKSALLDGSPIICVVAAMPYRATLFNGADGKDYQIPGAGFAEMMACADSGINLERNMLIALRHWAAAVLSAETILVGHNLIGFDLPRLRAAYLRHRLLMPQFLNPIRAEGPQPVFDTMREFPRYFTADRHGEKFISLAEVADRLGIPQAKEIVSGADVPDLHAAGKIKEILTYCLVDVLATRAIYLLLSGQDGPPVSSWPARHTEEPTVSDLLKGTDIPPVGYEQCDLNTPDLTPEQQKMTATITHSVGCAAPPPAPDQSDQLAAGLQETALIDAQAEEFCQAMEQAGDGLTLLRLVERAEGDALLKKSPMAMFRVSEAAAIARERVK